MNLKNKTEMIFFHKSKKLSLLLQGLVNLIRGTRFMMCGFVCMYIAFLHDPFFYEESATNKNDEETLFSIEKDKSYVLLIIEKLEGI